MYKTTRCWDEFYLKGRFRVSFCYFGLSENGNSSETGSIFALVEMKVQQGDR